MGDDVPLFVDALVEHGDFPLVRCNYLYVETDAPDPSWSLGFRGQTTPILLIELAAIVSQPLSQNRFTRPDLIEELYSEMESDDRLAVLASDLWLPVRLFAGRRPETGEVYRASARLFHVGFHFRAGRMITVEFTAMADELGAELAFSELETSAFREWHAQQIEEASAQFPKNAELVLRRREGIR